MTALNLTISKNGVANLVFDLPNEKINKLSSLVLLELQKALNVISGNKAIRILIMLSTMIVLIQPMLDVKQLAIIVK